MINVTNSNNNNIFKDFPQLTPGQVYSSLPKNDKNDKVELSSQTELASVSVSQGEKKGKKGFWAATVGTTILTAGVVAIILTKGFGSGSYKKINQLIDALNDKIYTSTLSKKSKTLFERADLAVAKGFKSFLTGMKSVSNFNAVKDSSVDKLLRSNKFTSKFADKVTTLFRKFSYDSIDSAYNKVYLQTDDFQAKISETVAKIRSSKTAEELAKEIDIKGVKRPLSEWLDIMSDNGSELKKVFDKGFNKQSRMERDVIREEVLKGLPEEVWETLWHKNGGILNFKENINTFKSYVTEDLSMDGKLKLGKEISEARCAFSNNITHNFNIVKTNIGELSEKMNFEDVESRNMLRSISKKMNIYKEYNGKTEISSRKAIVAELLDDFGAFAKHVKESPDYSDEVKESVVKQVDFVTNDILKNGKKGKLQDIMTIVSGLNHQTDELKAIDDDLAKLLNEKSESITKNINKATTMESNDLFDKCAEFKVGSAPNDVLGLAFPLGVGAVAVSRADDKKERVSTTLTTGIPILGTIGTMIYGTTRMLSGAKNLGMALIVGTALNAVGNACNKLYLDYQEKRSFTQMAIDAYKNNTLFNPTLKK